MTLKAASREIIFHFPDDFLERDDFESGWKVSGNALETALKTRKLGEDLVIKSDWQTFDLQEMVHRESERRFKESFWNRFFAE